MIVVSIERGLRFDMLLRSVTVLSEGLAVARYQHAAQACRTEKNVLER